MSTLFRFIATTKSMFSFPPQISLNWIFYNQAIPPSTSLICFQKTTLSVISKIQLSVHLPSHLYCKFYTCDSPSIQAPGFLELLYHYPSLVPISQGSPLALASTTPPQPFSSLTLVSHYRLFLSILHLLPAIIPSCGLMIPRSIIKITALQTSPLLCLF